MSGGETLALETQLLLQEVTQASQYAAVHVAVDADAGAQVAPSLSEFEAAKRALVDKLRKKKDLNRQTQQQLYFKRYGFAGKNAKGADTTPEESKAAAAPRVTPTKAKRMVRLPVVAASAVGPRHKKELLAKLRTQAIQQGAQGMAKLFGYSSYEEQIKHLNKLEKAKILLSEQQIELAAAKATKMQTLDHDGKEGDSSSDFVVEANEEDEQADQIAMAENKEPTDDGGAPMEAETAAVVGGDFEETQDLEMLEAAQHATASPVSSSKQPSAAPTTNFTPPPSSSSSSRRRRNHISLDEDDDGNEADSEQDGNEEEEEEGDEAEAGAEEEEESARKAPRDKAAGFRQLLQAEAKQERKRKRLRQGDNFVESEADEDEEEDVLKIGGLGDFGFGVPQATSKESKDAEDERNALKIREDDLEGIVDDLSDDERAQEQDLDEIYRRELEDQDRQQVKEVMRNVKEGFGRNRRAFSNLDGGLGARGRFNLNELVAADGDKVEAARLGLLESDEEINDGDDDEEGNESKRAEEVEDEDEEAEMERMLHERFTNQPKIYITSSESESEGENEVEIDDDQAAKEEIESDEERERQQMKLFSERARINRRMQRMKDMQRQIAQEVEEESAEKAPMPNLLLEEDEDSQELLKVLTRTDVATTTAEPSVSLESNKSARPVAAARSMAAGASRPKVGRFSSFGMGSTTRSTASFSRVADNCKLFSAGSGNASATKGFVFTSFSSEKADENAAPGAEDTKMLDAAPKPSTNLAESKSWSGSSGSSRAAKRPFAATNGAGATHNGGKAKKSKSDFFSVLASYQCVSHGQSSEPM